MKKHYPVISLKRELLSFSPIKFVLICLFNLMINDCFDLILQINFMFLFTISINIIENIKSKVFGNNSNFLLHFESLNIF